MFSQKEANNGPVHKIIVLIAYAHIPLTNSHAGISSGTRGLMFGLRFYLYPYLVYAWVQVQNFTNLELFEIKS